MEKIIIYILILCGIGYNAGLLWRVVNENNRKPEFYIYTYSEIPPENEKKKTTPHKDEAAPKFKGDTSHTTIPASYRQIIYSKSHRFNIEPSLVSAVIEVESNWDSRAVSREGAMGLMQLMPATAEDMLVSNPFDPEENIEGGTRYLRYLLDKFNGDVALALAAYNAGPKRIEKYRGIPPFKETKQYVKRILSIYKGNKLTL